MNNYQITVDQKNKLVKIVWNSYPEKPDEIAASCKELENTIKRFRKNEPRFLADISHVDARFLPPEAGKALHDTTVFLLSYVSKFAQVVPGLVFKKSMESVQGGQIGAIKSFLTEREAMDYLLS